MTFALSQAPLRAPPGTSRILPFLPPKNDLAPRSSKYRSLALQVWVNLLPPGTRVSPLPSNPVIVAPLLRAAFPWQGQAWNTRAGGGLWFLWSWGYLWSWGQLDGWGV